MCSSRSRALQAWVTTAALVSPILVTTGCMTGWDGAYRQSYQLAEVGPTDSTQLTELLQLGTEAAVTPSVTYRLTDRLIRTDRSFDASGTTSREGRFQHEPRADLMLTMGSLLWTQGAAHRTSRTWPSTGSGNTVTNQDLLEKLELRPEGLPSVTALLNVRDVKDDFFLDRTETRTSVDVGDARGAIDYRYSWDRDINEDNPSGVRSTTTTNTLRTDYDEMHFDGRVTTSLGLLLSQRNREDRTPLAGQLSLPTEVFARDGLYALDSTPSLGTLASTPALVDGDLATSTGINIGGPPSGGLTDHNIGVDLPQSEDVDTILVHTDVDPGTLFASQYTFAVWTSNDQLTWSLVTGSASYVYEQPFLRFRLAIPQVNTQYLKVVVTAIPPTAGAIFVTEIRVFEPAAMAGPASRTVDTDESTQRLTAGLSWQANDRLRMGYDLLLRSREVELDGQKVQDETQVDHSADLLWTATDKLDLSLRHFLSERDDDPALEETQQRTSGVLAYRALETLDLAFSANRGTTERNGVTWYDFSSAQGRVSAELLDTLSAELSAQKNTSDFELNQYKIDRDIIAGSLFANLLPDLDGTVRATREFGDVSGPNSGAIPEPELTSYGLILHYRPTELLTAHLDVEWRDTFASRGWAQKIQVDWFPFPGGSVDVQFDAQRRVDDASGNQWDLYSVIVQWAINPKAFFKVNYGVQDPKNATRIEFLNLTLEVRF